MRTNRIEERITEFNNNNEKYGNLMPGEKRGMEKLRKK